MGKLKTLTERSQPCGFCKLNEINEFKFGPLFERDGVVAHYYCVLFSYQMQQRGKDDEGILGFLTDDIKVELNRVKQIICFYCKKPNASVSCSGKKCGLTFHFPCGLGNGSLNQFKNSFKSFCIKHRPVQDIPQKALKNAEENQVLCVICQDSLDYKNLIDTIWANCCLTTWYHRDCLQMHALNSGYFFKCAICSNNKKFKNLAEKYGIFVPKKDASWELEPNAFVDLSRQYARCDARDCKCLNGREFDVVDTMWEIILCNSCGSQGVHIMCGLLKFHKPVWQCDLCRKVSSKIRSERNNRKLKNTSRRSNENNNEGEKIETKIVSDGDCSTSSVSDKKSSRTAAESKKSKRTHYASKRKRTDTEDKEISVKRRYNLRDCSALEELDIKANDEQGSPVKASELNKNLSALHIKDLETEKNSNKVNVDDKLKKLSNSSEDEDSDDPDNNFPLEEIKRRKKIEEEGLEVIDLTVSPTITEEEIKEVMQVYRNYQISDMKYRVKKEILVISDDEPEETEIIDKEETEEETKVSQSNAETHFSTQDSSNCCVKETSSVISLHMECNIRGNDVINKKRTTRNKTMTGIMTCNFKERTNCDENGAGRKSFSDKKKSHPLPPYQLKMSTDSMNTSKEIEVGKKRNVNTIISNIPSETSRNGNTQRTILGDNNPEMLNTLQKNIEKIIEDCLRQRKTRSKWEKRTSTCEGNSCESSNKEILESKKESKDDDIQIVEVINIRSILSKDNWQEKCDKNAECENEIIELE